ncbi:MAG: NifB/NifX family molybdenum-iron cluster-binding protein [Desulfomonile sp.]|nr:NifB/NifX family molybdenum-iron cluster-binding protein [Desulfomonile sp.]
MRIAVTSTGKDIDSPVDPRFGRARYILILDEKGTVSEVVDNTANVNALKGAGIQAGKLLADRKVDVLVTGHCGPNAFTVLEAAGIKVAVQQSGTVRQAVAKIMSGEAEFADKPNVEAHW